jgi:predicted small lipoprotein YifL
MKRLLLALFALMSIFVIAGCGQSGPLFLPGNPSSIATPPEQPAEPVPDEDEDQDEEDNNGET